MSRTLEPCAACRRHVRSSEPACPFCGERVVPGAPRPLPPVGLSRAGQIAWMLLFGASSTACAPAATASPPDAVATPAPGGAPATSAAPTAPPPPVSSDAGSPDAAHVTPEPARRPKAIYGAPDPEIHFPPVSFEPGSRHIPAAAAELLQGMARELRARPDHRIAIGGHADPSEGDAALPLSSRRARAVKDRLVALGVPAERLVVYAWGDRQHHGDPSTVEGQARNRRVDVTMTPPPPPPAPGASTWVAIYGESGFGPMAGFARGSAVLTPELRVTLNAMAEVLLAQPEVEQIEIVGKADPSEPRPEKLAEKRAMAARAFLVERGVPEERLTAKGYGATLAVRRNGSTDVPDNRAVGFRITKGELD